MKKLILLLSLTLMSFNCTPDEIQEFDCECRLETFELRTQIVNGLPRLVRVMVNAPDFEPNDCSLAELGWLETNDPFTEQKWNCVNNNGG